MAEHPSIARAASRTIPQFFIIDRSGDIIAQSTGDDVRFYLEHILSIGNTRSLICSGTRLEIFDEETILRLVPVSGNRDEFLAVFIEHVKPRGSFAVAVDRYKLTRREREVFALLARSMSNAQIAKRLSITENTVGDHVKSLLKKTSTKKRFELIARVYGMDELGPAYDETQLPIPS